MDPNFSFQRSEDSESEDNSQAIYFRNQIADYSETLEVALGAKTTVIFGQPVENRSVYIMERRPGCELGVAVINDRIRHSRYAFVEQLTSENVISFLGYYESHPLKITSKELPEFYKEQVFREVFRIVTGLQLHPYDTTLIDVAGSIDFLMNSVRGHLNSAKLPKSCVLKLSPFVYQSYLDGTEVPVYHIGLDRKYDADYLARKQKADSDSRLFYYDLEEGAGAHITAMTEVFKEFDNVDVVIDCQVFSTDYFQGISVPFPFSFTKEEIFKIFKLISSNKSKVRFLGICHFNPAVEERRSSSFLVDFLYKFIAS